MTITTNDLDDPRFVCSEGHPIHGSYTFERRMYDGFARLVTARPGSEISLIDNGHLRTVVANTTDAPITVLDADAEIHDWLARESVGIVGHCRKCPAFVADDNERVIATQVEFRLVVVCDRRACSIVQSCERISETTTQFMTRMAATRTNEGPMSYERATDRHITRFHLEPSLSRDVRRRLKRC